MPANLLSKSSKGGAITVCSHIYFHRYKACLEHSYLYRNTYTNTYRFKGRCLSVLSLISEIKVQGWWEHLAVRLQNYLYLPVQSNLFFPSLISIISCSLQNCVNILKPNSTKWFACIPHRYPSPPQGHRHQLIHFNHWHLATLWNLTKNLTHDRGNFYLYFMGGQTKIFQTQSPCRNLVYCCLFAKRVISGRKEVTMASDMIKDAIKAILVNYINIWSPVSSSIKSHHQTNQSGVY